MKILLILLALNFIADQLLQHPDVMKSKHKDSAAFLLHVLTWSVSMFLFMAIVMLRTGNMEIIKWWACVFIIHFSVEWCCLRMWTNHYYDKKPAKMVFWILLEQLIISSATIGLFVYFMEK